MTIAPAKKTQVIKDNRRHEQDDGSPEVQVAILTSRIAELTDHVRGHPKDHASKRGLIMMVGKRNRHLRYLARVNRDAYLTLIKRLGLRK
jgi:small subunit ribosomal protein S15